MVLQILKRGGWVLGLLMLLVGLKTARGAGEPARFAIMIYSDDACTKQKGPIAIDASKACVDYSYVDSKGKTTWGSNGHFRCYKDKVVFDKYPFNPGCDPMAKLINKDYSIPAGPKQCQRAPSHDGDVFENLVGYQYPGSESCVRGAATK